MTNENDKIIEEVLKAIDDKCKITKVYLSPSEKAAIKASSRMTIELKEQAQAKKEQEFLVWLKEKVTWGRNHGNGDINSTKAVLEFIDEGAKKHGMGEGK